MFLFRKFGGPPFAKSKIQRMSPNFIHCMYLIFEPILLRRKFWGILLRRNVYAMRIFDLSFGSQSFEFLRPVILASLAQSIFSKNYIGFCPPWKIVPFSTLPNISKCFLFKQSFA